MNCIKTIIETKWTTPHISFGFLDCPSCKQPMELEHCELLRPQLQAVKEIKELVEKLAVERAKFEGLDQHERLKTVGDHFYGNLKEFAMQKMSFYTCFKCKDPYFGGLRECGDEEQN